MQRPTYFPCLDGIRAIAFLLVLVAHSGYRYAVPGGLGVTVFFFLSGYLITSLLRSEFAEFRNISIKQFYYRRAVRILPPLYITLAVAALVHQVSWLNVGYGNALGWISTLVWVQNYAALLTHNKANLPAGMGVVWSLMIEEHFYVAFPLLYRASLLRAWRRSSQVGVLLAVCAIVCLWRFVLVFYFKTALVQTEPRWTYMATDARIDSIAFGCLLAIWKNPWCNDPIGFLGRHAKLLAGIGCGLLLLTLVVREPHFRETIRYSIQGIAFIPIFYLCIANPESRWVSWLTLPPLRWLGWTSYSLYLCHELFLGLVTPFLPPWRPLVLAVGFALALVYAWAMRRGVEIPLRKLRSRKEFRSAGPTDFERQPALPPQSEAILKS